MGLYDIRTGKCVYEKKGNTPTFYDSVLELDIEDGIKIPRFAQKMFNGCSVVHIGDPEFEDALRYYAMTILNDPEKRYEWRDN